MGDADLLPLVLGMAEQKGVLMSQSGGRVMQCPECGRVASVPEWVKRPVCVHAWDNNAPEVWDGDDSGAEGGRRIEDSPNEEWRTPGPKTWTEMVPYE